mgnify:FL=1
MKNDDLIIEPSHKGLKILVTLLCIIVFLCLVGGAYYYFVLTNPVLVFNSFRKEFNSNTTNMLLDNKAKRLNGNITFSLHDNTYQDIYEILDKVKFIYDVKVDSNNKVASVSLMSEYDSKELLDIDAYLQDNKSYIKIPSVYDKYVSVNIEEYEKLFEKDTKVNTLLEKYQDLLKEKLGRNNIKREKATWTYNDNKEDGYSYTLTFNYSDLKEFIDIYNNLYSEDLSIDNNSSLTIKLYSKGLLNSFVSYDVDLQVENTSLNITKTHSDKIAIKFTSEDGETNILVSNNNANSYNIEVNFNGDNKIIVSISMEDVSEITKHSITDSVSMSELTEEDYKVISDNILKNEVLNNLVEDISKVFNKD